MDATDSVAVDGAASPQSEADYLDELPRGLVEAQLIEAELDAYRVSSYLDAFLEALRSEYPDQAKSLNWRTMLSANALLELAAALRVLEWEWSGLVRDDMNLPGGEHAVRQVLLNAGSDDLQPSLSLQLVKVFAEHFAWSSMRDLGAHILLDRLDTDEDQLVDYIARVLLEQFQHGVT